MDKVFLKVGTQVIISKKSGYYDRDYMSGQLPPNVVGEIQKVTDDMGRSLCMSVKWICPVRGIPRSNSYALHDVELYSSPATDEYEII